MKAQQTPKVAILLATYNGARFIKLQICSLKENATPFTLHWLDDHSNDNTRDVVRSSACSASIELAEWHQPKHLGLPSSFFQLLECVEADIYLFCDQDDIWQPGKIDATVANLIDDIASPVLCFSDSLMFNDNNPEVFRFASKMTGRKKSAKALHVPQTLSTFTSIVAPGHTQGFTRPVREIFLRHKAIAHEYAFMHDWWIHDITIASGTVRMLSNAPTALWRQHAESFCANLGGSVRSGVTKNWQSIQYWRRIKSRHAQGFVLSASTLPLDRNEGRLHSIAQLSASLDRRQTPAALIRLARHGAMPQSLYGAALFSIACLCSDATSS